DGEYEWNFNDKVARAFEREIKNYEGVSLLRTDDASGKTDVPLRTRTNRANSWKADVYISFHHNANTGRWSSAWTGVETFYHANSSANSSVSKRLAQSVQKALVKAYGLADRGIKTNNLHITRETNMPAVLVEGGFMDSTIDIKKLRDDSVLAQAGILIARSVANIFGLKRKGESTPKSSSSKGSSTSTKNNTIYRVRKSSTDAKSQIGAFSNLNNAKKVADE